MPALESLFSKVTGLKSATLFEKRPCTGAFLQIFPKFLETYLKEHFRASASKI